MPANTSGRLPQTGTMRRIHTHMSPDAIKVIDKAAGLKGMSRSFYIATEVLKRAKADVQLAKGR